MREYEGLSKKVSKMDGHSNFNWFDLTVPSPVGSFLKDGGSRLFRAS